MDSEIKMRAVGGRPREWVTLGERKGVGTAALLDSGSQCSMVNERFYQQHLRGNAALHTDDLSFFRLSAANGTYIPLIGYLMVDVEVRGTRVENTIFMVMKESEWGHTEPCLIGTNVLQRLSWYRAAFPSSVNTVSNNPEKIMRVRVASSPVLVANTITNVEVTCGDTQVNGNIFVEPQEQCPKQGLFMMPAFVPVSRGKARVPVVNMSDEDYVLRKRTFLGTGQVATPAEAIDVQVNVVSTEAGSPQRVNASGTTSLAPETDGGLSHQGSDQGHAPSLCPDIASLQFGPALKPEEREQLEEMVREFQDIFAWRDADLGFTDLVKHRIVLTDDRPIAQAYRPIPRSALSEVRQHLDDLLKRGIIQPSSSPYAAPVVLVRKKSGELRLCCDYRKINAITRRDAFPIPRIEEQLDALGGSKFFSSLDLASGYHQVELEEESRPKSAFVCPFGLFEWTRMPFGLTGAPSTFQRLMTQAMHGFIYSILVIYLDDILVYGQSFSEHMSNLRKVFERIREIGVRLNPEKCRIGHDEVVFLGHTVSGEGISTDPGKISAVKELPVPKTVSELRSFLGFCSYYRKFVKGFSQIAAPLNKLVKLTHELYPHDKKKGENKPLGTLWTPECQTAFENLKSALTNAPVLAYADYSKDFQLEIDASLQGLGAVLYQEHNGQRKVIAFASRSLRVDERTANNYSSFKLELMAKRWAMADKFRAYLLGHHCTVYTDNGPLSHWRNAKLGAVEMRWAAEIDIFDHDTLYKSGRTNIAADFLSRHPEPVNQNQPAEELIAVSTVKGPILPGPATAVGELEVRRYGVPTPLPPASAFCNVITQPANEADTLGLMVLSQQELIEAQKKDQDLTYIRRLKANQTTKVTPRKGKVSTTVQKYIRQLSSITEVDGLLMKERRSMVGITHVPLIPKALQRQTLEFAHDKAGHQGAERTHQLLVPRCYWPNMLGSCQEYVSACNRCQQGKSSAHPVITPNNHLKASYPFEVVGLDFLKVDMASDGRQYILTMTDFFSKMAVGVPCHDQSAKTVVKALLSKWILHYGVPLRLHSDQGKQFDCEVIRLLCDHYKIRMSHTSPYNPKGNGATERLNRSILGLLSTLTPEEKVRWPMFLPELLFYYNSTPHSSTGQAPFTILFGRDAILPLDIFLGRATPNTPDANEAVQKHIERLNLIRQRVAARAPPKSKDPPLRGVELRRGDLVRMKLHSGHSKLADKYGEALFVVEDTPDQSGTAFLIRNTGSGSTRYVSGENLKKVVPGEDRHIAQMPQIVEQRPDRVRKPPTRLISEC